LIPLSIGDPTVFGNLLPPAQLESIINRQAQTNKYNGYAHSCGLPEARAAIAEKFTRPEAPLSSDDVIIASGASGALAIALSAVAGPGENVLVPQPAFSLYLTICGHYGFEGRQYPLLPDQRWEADLLAMEKLIDSKTRAILINNPSNPSGSNYSKQHLIDILSLAEKHHLPIIADEIYADMVFAGETFHPIASLTTEVPVLAVGGIGKQYVIPGFRVGWIMFHDRKSRLQRVRAGCESLTHLIVGANTLAQACLPELLLKTDKSYYSELGALMVLLIK